MDNNLNKLQIRAKVMSLLSEIKTEKDLSHSKFKECANFISEIQEKSDLFEILIKELNKRQEPYNTIISTLLIEVIPEDILKENIMNTLVSSKISDEVKYKLIHILNDLGSPLSYEEMVENIKNPEALIDYDTQQLLAHATVNPETQIDFMDFLISLPDSDKLMLINSLSEDFQGDNLANILRPLLYSNINEEILKRVVEILGESKSSLAVEPINYIMTQTEDESLKTFYKKNLNKLKLSGASEEKAIKFYKSVLFNSKIFKCYTTIPDGHDNQGIIVVRARDDGYFQMFAVVINSIIGIIDSFGFNFIGPNELERIISKFYHSEKKIEVPAQYCKSLINRSVNLNKIFKESISYEFIAWNTLLQDTEELSITVEEAVKQKNSVIKIDEISLKKLFKTQYLDKWFMTPSDNEMFQELVNKIIKEENVNINAIEVNIDNSFEIIWDKSSTQQLDNRIINTVYLLNEMKDDDNAQILYSILFNPEIKKEIMINIIKKSIYEHMVLLKQNIEEFSTSTNIFKAKQTQAQKTINLRIVKEIIKNIEDNWVNE